MAIQPEIVEADAPGDPDAAEPEERGELLQRDRDLLQGARPNAPIRKRLTEIFQAVKDGFENQAERADDIEDWWRCYHCELDSNTFYNGNATIYVPIVRDAVNARATRFVNQLFPQGGRAVEAFDSDGSSVNALVGLLDHYIRETRFKTQVAKPLCRNGDIEGQYNLYVYWNVVRRQLVSRETHGPIDPETGQEMPGEEIEDITEEEVEEGCPGFEVLHDSDVLIWPATADSVEDAIQRGGGVAIVRRWSKAMIDTMAENGIIRADEADDLKDEMGKVAQSNADLPKQLAELTGILKKGKEAVVWEVWTALPLGAKGYEKGGTPRLCRIIFGPEQRALGVKRNPYWNDRCPLLSVPVEKVAGVAKGDSLVAPIATLQYEANDAVNQGADAAAYSALPIIARDPEKGNGPLVLNLAALWDIAPDSVKFLSFPDLTPRALQRVQYCIQQIFQTLGVNPAMIPQQTRAGKPNQAQIAQEQQVDLLTTAEAVSVLEEGILTPAVAFAVDLDYQYREREISVRMFGEMGREAFMQRVAPLQNRAGFTFVWRGGDQVRQNALMMQQGTAAINVARGLRQELMAEGLQLRLGPVVEAQMRNIFGPVLGARTIVDLRDQLTLDVEEEVAMLLDGFEVWPHPLDNDQQKIAAFRQAMAATGDPHGTIRVRLQAQLKQANAKAQAQMMMRMQQQAQGAGGGQGRPPGMPQAGAAPAGPRLIKGPPGTVPPARRPRAGAVAMPRKM